LCWTLNHQNT
jgi:hypothetical protein